ARLSIFLTDEPGDVLQAMVRIDEIYLQGEPEASEEEEEEPSEGRVVLLDDPVTTDLLTLVDDVQSLVDDATVPEGAYGQLRFVINDACLVVAAENEETDVYATSGFEECGEADDALLCPSCDQTGLKVTLPGDQLDVFGEDNELLVDFSVEESFEPGVAGQSGMWVMTPVLTGSEMSS
ncbi:MAG: DUF4382 domain-containing protein, partial [Gemmatimonadota bacterium]